MNTTVVDQRSFTRIDGPAAGLRRRNGSASVGLSRRVQFADYARLLIEMSVDKLLPQASFAGFARIAIMPSRLHEALIQTRTRRPIHSRLRYLAIEA